MSLQIQRNAVNAAVGNRTTSGMVWYGILEFSVPLDTV